jgi:basic amino acid/polyamine antiporter, APA family
MARQNLLPDHLGRVHRRRRTPHIAILVLFFILVPLALMGAIAELAAASVLLLLIVFAAVNGALFILKGRKGEPTGRFEIPRIIPALGFLVCLGLIVVRVSTGDWEAPAIAGALLLASFLIYLLMRWLDPEAISEIGEDTVEAEAPTKSS